MSEDIKKEEQPFHVWLKNYRQLRGWSIKFITKEMGIPYQAWLRWEKGKSLPAEYWQKMLRQRLMQVGLNLGGE